MMDSSPADDNDRPYDAADANDPDDDDGTFPVPVGYTWTDVHGVKHVIGEGWVVKRVDGFTS